MENKSFLMGYDNRGNVTMKNGRVYRYIDPSYQKMSIKLYHKYLRHKLFNKGFVQTELRSDKRTFIHELLPISYPFEWSANMIKDALLHQLSLLLTLDGAGMTLKDMLPNNILFKYTRPVFVDFFSLVFTKDLKSETSYITYPLGIDPRFTLFQQQFIPFFLIPFLASISQNHSEMRYLLKFKACNTGHGVPTVFESIFPQHITELLSMIRQLKMFMTARFVHNRKITVYIKNLMRVIRATNVTPPGSGYASYYSAKNEFFSFKDTSHWREKQVNLYKILKKEKPKQVLDIGSNTGWFSLLAEQLGARVIATDIDEFCIDFLYRQAKRKHLNILPLLLSFESMEEEIFGIAGSVSEPLQKHTRIPLYRAPAYRLQSDMVLFLGLLHHLVLGRGHSVDWVMKRLALVTKKCLVLEYVDITDEKITSEPSFFPSLKNYNGQTYNQNVVVRAGKKYFKRIEIFPSYPESRTVLVFYK